MRRPRSSGSAPLIGGAAACVKGQGAVEFVAILGMMLLIVLVVLTISNQRLIDLSTQKIMVESRSSVKNLADAANHVYSQGIGAKKYVFIRLPVDANLSKSFIANRTIILNVRGTDISALTDGNVTGNFPSSAGGSWLKVESMGSYVQIGNYYLELDSGSLYVNMANTTNKTVTIRALNWGNRSINVTLYPTWTDSPDASRRVNLTVPTLTAEILEASSETFTLQFNSGNRTGGIYTGLLTFVANFTDGGAGPYETADVPVTVEVSIQPVYRNIREDINQSTLVIVLLSNATTVSIGKNLSLGGGPFNNPYNITLFVCARPDSDVSDVHIYSLNQSVSIFGIFGLEYYTGTITPSQCKFRNINLTSNATPVTGIFNETIIAIPVNASTPLAANNATLLIGAAIDATGPAVLAGNVSLSPAYPRTSVNISANISDTGGLSGQVWINTCILQNASVRNYSMGASDGAYDTQLEVASYNFTSISDGNVSLNITCNDSFNNWGTNYTLNFTVDSIPPQLLSTNFGAYCGSYGNPCGTGVFPNGTRFFYLSNPVWLNATVNDSATGGANITACDVYVDTDVTPLSMVASDGTFDSSFEYANVSLGSLAANSTHNLTVNCTDRHGNIATNYTQFVVNTSCQNIDTAVTVTLQSDVHASGGGTCFNITASGANLNCNNYAISGLSNAGTYGVYVNASNVGVGNCTVTSFDSGILYNRTLYGRIENVTTNSHTNAGVYLLSTNLSNISGISASSNAIGAYLVNVTGGNITSGTMYENAAGATALLFSQTSSVKVTRVYMNATGFHIRLDYSSTNNTFFYNNITGSGVWVNNTGTANDNYFNTSLGSGAGAGNYYWNVTLYDANDSISSPDGFADKGTQYPFNWTYLGSLWNVSGNDSGPATSRQS
jgi:hypothetical protein